MSDIQLLSQPVSAKVRLFSEQFYLLNEPANSLFVTRGCVDKLVSRLISEKIFSCTQRVPLTAPCVLLMGLASATHATLGLFLPQTKPAQVLKCSNKNRLTIFLERGNVELERDVDAQR